MSFFRGTPHRGISVVILAACFEHEARCGTCDLSEAREQADVEVRAAPEGAWSAWREERRQRLIQALLG